MSEELKKLGKLIKTWRILSEMTQAELAKKIGVSRSTVGFWESGTKEPSATHFIRLVTIMGIPWESIYLILNIEKKTPDPEIMERLSSIETALRRKGIMI